MSKSVLDIIESLPTLPGVYQFLDKNGDVLYVGKAKNLKHRVKSYFSKQEHNKKTIVLVRKISDIKVIIVDSESDALLLENNLIKKFKPKYNILLKDDKSFPWICIKNERFPRVLITREIVKDGSEYYGPYTSKYFADTLISLFREVYKIRTCKYLLSKKNINDNKIKPCLQYHIGNCNAPCIGLISHEDYTNNIDNIRTILKGNVSSIVEYLKLQLDSYVLKLEFEKAEKIKYIQTKLKDFKSKSVIVSQLINNVDVFNIYMQDGVAFVNYFKINNGSIVQAYTVEVNTKLDESVEDVLVFMIDAIRYKFNSQSSEVIVPFNLNIESEVYHTTVPKIGDKKKLLDLSMKNILYYKGESLKRKILFQKNTRLNRLMSTMQKDLQLKEEPYRIECFDNSNIQGSFPVASCVVFINGVPAKKEYRHFNIKTVEGPNDFASMEEVIFRRYKRCIEDKTPLPQLVVVDGGKGQLSAALKALDELNLLGNINIISIAKRLEEIYIPGEEFPLYVDKDSETLKVIKHLRDESHRFAINFHRDKRSKYFINSELDEIKGVGTVTKDRLYSVFKTINGIKNASIEELAKEIGYKRANTIYSYFRKK